MTFNIGKAVGYQPAGVEMSKGKPNIGGLVLGKAIGYQPAEVEMSKGKPNIGSLVLGKAVGYQPTGVEMSKGKPKYRRFGAWEGCRLPTCRSRNVKE